MQSSVNIVVRLLEVAEGSKKAIADAKLVERARLQKIETSEKLKAYTSCIVYTKRAEEGSMLEVDIIEARLWFC